MMILGIALSETVAIYGLLVFFNLIIRILIIEKSDKGGIKMPDYKQENYSLILQH